jgi:hypothetical protein
MVPKVSPEPASVSFDYLAQPIFDLNRNLCEPSVSSLLVRDGRIPQMKEDLDTIRATQ